MLWVWEWMLTVTVNLLCVCHSEAVRLCHAASILLHCKHSCRGWGSSRNSPWASCWACNSIGTTWPGSEAQSLRRSWKQRTEHVQSLSLLDVYNKGHQTPVGWKEKWYREWKSSLKLLKYFSFEGVTVESFSCGLTSPKHAELSQPSKISRH